LKRASVLVLALLAGGCALQRSTTGQWIQGRAFESQAVVAFVQIPPSGEANVSGVNAAIKESLFKHGIKFRPTSTVPAQQFPAIAKETGAVYVLTGSVSEWEDNATEWSANPDRAALSLELYDENGTLIATGSHRLVGSTLAAAPLSPDRFIPELVDHALGRIFGWRPTVFYGS
jgi:hypothetical protein